MRAQVELLEHVAARRVDENDVIGKIIRDQQSVSDAWGRDHSKAGGIRKDRSLGASYAHLVPLSSPGQWFAAESL